VLKELSPRQRILLGALLAATLATRLFVASADFRNLIALDIYQDDAFYYLKIARNLLDGRGLTFDGTNPTNGFHPLYLLTLLPLVKLSGDDLAAPIRLSALALSALSVLSAFLLYRVARLVAGRGVAFTALAIFAISPYFVAFGVNGQETGLAMLFGLLVVDRYLRAFRPPAQPSRGSAALFGVACALAVLARSDLVLLLLALASDRLLLLRGERWRAAPGTIAMACATAFATWLAWGITSHALTGSWLPRSGEAVREVALNYGWLNLEPIWSARDSASLLFDPEHPPAAFHADVATRFCFVFLFEHPLLAVLRAHIPFSVWPTLDRYAPYNAFRASPGAGTGAALALGWAAASAARRRRRNGRKGFGSRHSGLGRVLLVHSILLLVGYTFYAPAHWYFSRYLTFLVLLSLVYGLARGNDALQAIPIPSEGRHALRIAAAIALVACQLAILPVAQLRRLRADTAGTDGFLGNWVELGPRIPSDRKLGAFQAGIYSYFGRRDVVNLDGVVNPAAHAALEQKRLHEYIRSEHIDYILDWSWILNSLCLRHAPPGNLRLRVLGRSSAHPPAVLYAIGSSE